MEEYDIKEINYKALEYLRKQTILGPIATFKIASARKQAEIVRNFYLTAEHQDLGIDTSLADELEYQYRYKAFQNRIYLDWLNYGNDKKLDEYTDEIIMNNLDKSKVK